MAGMLTYTNDRYYFPMTTPEGRTYRLTFGPGDVVFDGDTGIINSLHIRFRDGRSQDLILLPAGQSEMEAVDLVADILGAVGAQILHSQIRVGNELFDRITEVIIDQVMDDEIDRLKRYFHQRGGAYYDIRTGELCGVKVLETYDVEYD